jgi:hypothetical protein
MFNVKHCSDARCNGTSLIIRAQVQKQSPKWSNCHTWTHITLVVQWNHEGFRTNQHTNQDRTWFNITHHMLQCFTSSSKVDHIHRSHISYYKLSLKVAEANSLTHLTHTEFKYNPVLWSQPTKAPGWDNIRDHARDLVLVTRQVETILAVAIGSGMFAECSTICWEHSIGHSANSLFARCCTKYTRWKSNTQQIGFFVEC